MQINKHFIIVLVLCRFGQNDAFTFIPTGSQSTLSTSTRKSLALEMSGKDNHRARVEKNLEDMMDRDWRLFRAKLVAQEAHDAQLNAERNQKRVSDISNDHDEKQAKQEKFGNIFAAFFHHKGNDDASIFNGDNIGTPESMIPDMCEDPFVSKDELPVLFQPKVNVNKHRWAHSLSHIEPGCVLIANEKLGGVFHQTVVLVIEHSDVTGSTGIIINRPMEGNLNKIASETQSNLDLSLKLAFNSSPVTYGGPVMQEEYSILHGYGEVEGSKKVAPGVFVGGSEQLMFEVRKHYMSSDQALFVKGHSAWVPNQLSREVSKGVWYPASVSSDFILRYAGAPVSDDDNPSDLWADILTCMGGKFQEVAKQYSKKGDRRMMP